jgi:Fe2+ or Zn2+ uptake regulation protein
MGRTRETKQKRIIEDEIQKFETSFTADELYSRVNKIDPKISLATVYRYLRDTGCENLHTYYCDKRKIYSTTNISHCHFKCSNCGREYHVDVKEIDFQKYGVKSKVCHFQLDLYGICEDCANDEDL